MKILHVINTLRTGGAEKLLSELAPVLGRSGNQVDVYVFDDSDTYYRHVLEKSGIHVSGYKAGCNVYNPLIIPRLMKVMRGYDIVHTHNTSPQLFVALAGMFVKTKLVTTEHSTSNRRRGHSVFRLLDKWMYGRYSHIVCISEKASDLLCEYLPCLKERVSVVENGIDVRAYETATPLSISEKGTERFVVTMVSGFRYQKDHTTLIKAFGLLPGQDYELWLVGDGERREVIENEILAEGISDRVRLWGVRTDVCHILKSSDVVVQSSHIEGFGLAAVEGMASGRPVIATNVPGLSEVVSGAGLTVEHEDAKALAEAIVRLRTDRSLYEDTASRCKERARKYDLKATGSRYEDIYTKVIAE